MDLVIDIQCFKNKGYRIVPKEVGIVALNGNFCAHWIVSPPTNLCDLTEGDRRQNNWLSTHHHGLDYFEGETPLKLVEKALQDISKKARKIYVRGKEKWNILHKITIREIINLEYNCDCPSFDKLSSDVYCIHHALKPDFHNFAVCA